MNSCNVILTPIDPLEFLLYLLHRDGDLGNTDLFGVLVLDDKSDYLVPFAAKGVLPIMELPTNNNGDSEFAEHTSFLFYHRECPFEELQ